MRLLDRYLFGAVFGPFCFLLVAFCSLLIVGDLFGSLDDFVQHKAPLEKIVAYYAATLPWALLYGLPTTLLFASLFALLRLAKNSELVAMRAGGLSMLRLSLPFLLLALGGVAALYAVLLGPSGAFKAQRDRIMAEIRGQPLQQERYDGVVWQGRDGNVQRTWFVQQLDVKRNTATIVEVVEQNGDRDERKIVAASGAFRNGAWTFATGKVLTYDLNGLVKKTESFTQKEFPEFTQEPRQLVGFRWKPSELTHAELRAVLRPDSGVRLTQASSYSTQMWSQLTFPWVCLIFVLFALAEGQGHHRRDAAAGVFAAIFVLIAFIILWETSLALGRSERITPALAVTAPLLVLASITLWRGRHLFAR